MHPYLVIYLYFTSGIAISNIAKMGIVCLGETATAMKVVFHRFVIAELLSINGCDLE